MAIYVGVNGVAKKVKQAYIGVNGIAKKINQAYIGVNGNAVPIYKLNPILPSGYQQLEWIKFDKRPTDTGWQDYSYGEGVNTYILPSQDVRIVMSFSINYIHVYNLDTLYLFESRFFADDNRAYVTGAVRTNQWFGFDNVVYYNGYPEGGIINVRSYENEGVLTGTRYTVDLNVDNKDKTSTYDEIAVYLYNNEGYYSIPNNTRLDYNYKNGYIHGLNRTFSQSTIHLFSGFFGGSSPTPNLTWHFCPPAMTFYSCQLYTGRKTLARDYYPAHRNSDDTIGLYDTVENIFYTIDTGGHDELIIPGPTI